MNKKLLYLLLLIIFSSTQIYAQGVRFGFKVGASYSELSSFEYDVTNRVGDPVIAPFSSVDKGRYGMAAAFLAEVPLTYDLSFQPEFAFSSQGNKFEEIRLDYLQLPLGLKYSFNKLYVIAGPQVGLKISFSEQSENFKSFDVLAFGGIGYFLNESLFIEARFTKGFLEAFEEDAAVVLPYTENGNERNTDNYLVNASGTNQYFNISIGYRL